MLNMKNIISKISSFILLVLLICFCQYNIKTFALTVAQDPVGIYCIKDNGARAISEWVEIDFEGDNYLEYYYFDKFGYLILKGFTPDGYIVNEKGQWIVNGVVQKKYYGKQTKDNSKTISYSDDKQNSSGKSDNRVNVNGATLFSFIFTFIVLLIIIIGITFNGIEKGNRYDYQTKQNTDEKNYNHTTISQKYDYQTKQRRTTINHNDSTIDRSFWWNLRSDTDKIGEQGEDEVAETLRYINNDFIVLRNINLPRKNNKPVQIDFLCVTGKGIFVIEVKNWLGTIVGNYEDDEWHSIIYDSDNIHKNPIKQNEWHIDVLRRNIRRYINYCSIVVFTDRADISNLRHRYNNTFITNTNNLYSLIYKIYETSDAKIFNDYKIIAEQLRMFANK